MTLILSNEEITGLLTMPDTLGALEDAYGELAAGRGATRRRSDILAPVRGGDATYGLKSMDGVLPKAGVSAIRINSDIVTWPEIDGSRRRVKVPAAPNQRFVGLVLLFSMETAEPLAIFPDGVVQRMRVGAASGLGAKYMAREDAKSVGIIGSGWQAGTQLMAICAVRPIENIRCYSPNGQNRVRFAREMTNQLGIEVEPVLSPEQAFAGADVALCATSIIAHVFFERFIEPGMHIGSIKMPEIEPAVLATADRLGVHSNAGTPEHVTTGDYVSPERTEGVGFRIEEEFDFSDAVTLPDLITGTAIGRTSPDQVTCFLNNLGMGFQFAAVGALVYRKAKEAGIGNELPTDWFTEKEHP